MTLADLRRSEVQSSHDRDGPSETAAVSAAKTWAHETPDIGGAQEPGAFPAINRGYARVLRPGRLSLGLVVPIESYPSRPVPEMADHVERVQLAEKLGYAAVWLRDVPFHVPSFGDAGQIFDPFAYLGLLAAKTEQIALGVASVVLPLRHPAHVAKAATSIDVLSGGRLLLGVASGDRPEEYPALNLPFTERGARFRESFAYIQHVVRTQPTFDNAFGHLRGGLDMLPKPTGTRLPLLITGSSRQSPEWIARNGDGWLTYPRSLSAQARVLSDWRQRVEESGTAPKPALQSLYLDLADDPDARPKPIHLGFRIGIRPLRDYLHALQEIGVNHVALNLRFHHSNVEDALVRLAGTLLPEFGA